MDTGALIGLVLAVIANLSTFYFWLVKARKERPDLKACAVAPFEAVLEGGRRAFLLRKFEKGTWKNDCGDIEGASYYYLLIKGVAANHSALPNTVTGFRAWLKTRAGGWQQAKAALVPAREENGVKTSYDPLRSLEFCGDPRSLPLPEFRPFNLTPLEGVMFRLVVWLIVPHPPEVEGAKQLHRHVLETVSATLADPVAVKVELKGLSGEWFADVLSAEISDPEKQ